ncbi:MAG: transcription antitermination factor NusB [Coriobacteriia bacterium]|nr:transcription antitermination factor NusB [Coriobacteriia bacterium]
MSIAPARRAALQVLKRVREREAFGPETLDAVLTASGLSRADLALATRLTYGTLQTSGVLDEAIDRLATKSSGIEPRVRDAMRLAAYELLFARTPPRAAVHEGVDAVRAVRPQAAGMANAVLRRLADEAPTFPWGDASTDDAALARLTGHPMWIVGLLVTDLGREAASLALRADLEPAPLYLWHNPFLGQFGEALALLEQDGAEPRACEPGGCIEAGVPSSAVRGECVASGACLVTDAAAQIAARALAPRPGQLLVDIAAGRGTKTIQLQALACAHGPAAEVVALDIHAFKSDILDRRMIRMGVPGVRVLTGDATAIDAVAGMPTTGTVDGVLLDAPCSGLGTLRRRAEKRWRVSESDIDALTGLQYDLLVQSASLVRPRGVVVYSTCSIARRENHDVVSRFLSSPEGAGFGVKDITEAVPDMWRRWIGPEGWFQSVPEPAGPDGHFVAALERQG